MLTLELDTWKYADVAAKSKSLHKLNTGML